MVPEAVVLDPRQVDRLPPTPRWRKPRADRPATVVETVVVVVAEVVVETVVTEVIVVTVATVETAETVAIVVTVVERENQIGREKANPRTRTPGSTSITTWTGLSTTK